VVLLEKLARSLPTGDYVDVRLWSLALFMAVFVPKFLPLIAICPRFRFECIGAIWERLMSDVRGHGAELAAAATVLKRVTKDTETIRKVSSESIFKRTEDKAGGHGTQKRVVRGR
jgi:hypothetical protein